MLPDMDWDAIVSYCSPGEDANARVALTLMRAFPYAGLRTNLGLVAATNYKGLAFAGVQACRIKLGELSLTEYRGFASTGAGVPGANAILAIINAYQMPAQQVGNNVGADLVQFAQNLVAPQGPGAAAP